MKDHRETWFRTLEALGYHCELPDIPPGEDFDGIRGSIVLPYEEILVLIQGNMVLPEILESGRRLPVPTDRVIAANRMGELMWLKHPDAPLGGLVFMLHCQGCDTRSLLAKPIDLCPDCGGSHAKVVGAGEVALRWLAFDVEAKEVEPESPALLAPLQGPLGSRDSARLLDLRIDLARPSRVHRWPQASEIEALIARYPNFQEVGALVLRELSLSQHRKDQAVRLPRILLVGSPSCGKSSFADELSRILVGEDFLHLDFGHQIPHFALVGSDSTFREAKEGRILRLLAGGQTPAPVRNPMLILDEMDKIIEGFQFDPVPALQSLLDDRTAKNFIDEYLGIPVDASGVLVIGIANDSRRLPRPLMSRFVEFHIADYTNEELVEAVVPEVYRVWKLAFWEGTYPDQLSRETRALVVARSGGIPRQFARALSDLAADGHPELYPRPTFESITTETYR